MNTWDDDYTIKNKETQSQMHVHHQNMRCVVWVDKNTLAIYSRLTKD